MNRGEESLDDASRKGLTSNAEAIESIAYRIPTYIENGY